MYSSDDTAKAVGCPIRKFPGQSLLAANRNLSQRATSFIASVCLGIHQMLLVYLIKGTGMHSDQPAGIEPAAIRFHAVNSRKDTNTRA
jgi:hypothetical protein